MMQIQPGMLVMVIGITQPANSHMLGKVFTAECFVPAYTEVPEQYCNSGTGPAIFGCDVWIISGRQERSAKQGRMAFGYSGSQPHHLMPLPPLEDDAIIASTETPKEIVKC